MSNAHVPTAAYRTTMATTYQPVPTSPGGPYMPPGGVVQYPEPPTGKPPRSGKFFIAIAATAVTAGVVGAVVGVVAGVVTSTRNAPEPATAKTPTAAEVYAANVDLCTRFAAAYAAMPTPQTSGMDVLPVATAVEQALNDNPNADRIIRDAVGESNRLLQEHAATLIHESDKGFVISPKDWSVDKANAADKRAWDVCQSPK